MAISEFLMLVIAVEAITNILTKGEIFHSLQEWAEQRETFTQKLFSCSYCLSVWVAALLVGPCMLYPQVKACLWIFVVHRIANVFHTLYDYLQVKADILKEVSLRE